MTCGISKMCFMWYPTLLRILAVKLTKRKCGVFPQYVQIPVHTVYTHFYNWAHCKLRKLMLLKNKYNPKVQ